MEQMITKEQIAEAAEQYAEQENSAWTNDYNGFEAGANFVMQLLQQTPCTTQLLADSSTEDEYCKCKHPTLGNSVSRCGTCDCWFRAIA